jgi:MFS family permease
VARSVSADSRWFLGLLAAATLLQAATAVARPMASYRALEIGMPPSSLGLVAAAFAIAPVVFALAIGRWIDRRGEFPFLVGATLMMVAATLALALAGSAASLLLFIGLLGLAQLMFVVSNQTLVGSRSQPGSFDSRFGYLSFVASLGQLIGPASAGLIASRNAGDGTSQALLFGAALSLAAIPLVGWLWRRDPGPAVPAPAVAPAPVRVRAILRTPGMLPAMLASMTVLATMDVMVVYLPALGEERGLSVATIGALLAVRAGASMASRLALGRVIGRFGRDRLMVASLVVAAGSVVVLPFLPVPLMFVAMVFAGLTLGMAQPMTMAWVATRAAVGARGTAMSLRLLGNRVGQVVIPLAAGSLAAVTGAAGVVAAAGLTVAASAVVVANRRSGS